MKHYNEGVAEWALQSGIDHLKERLEAVNELSKDCNRLLAILLSGGGAALYLVTQHTEFLWTALAVSFWLFGLSAALTYFCMMYSDYPSTFNSPKNLLQEGYALEELQAFEADNIQRSIEKAKNFLKTKSDKYNKCLFATCATPIVAILAWVLGCYLSFV